MDASVGNSPLRWSISWSVGHLMSLTTTKPLPSGVHTNSFTPSGRLETFCASPPASDSTQICGPPWRLEMNASDLPSGAQAGLRSEPGPCVSARVCPVASSASQMREMERLSCNETVPIVYATHLPSGDSCGSPTFFKAR